MVTGAPKDLRHLALAAGALFVLACGHTDPFSTPPFGRTQPFDPTPPVRLTLNTGPDRGASWLPDGSGIMYSAQQPDRADADVCLAELPPDGGSQRRLVCDLTRADSGLTNAFESPAAAADGRLAFVASSNSIGGSSPVAQALAIAPTLDGRNATSVQRLPYTLPSEPTHSGISQLRWLSDNQVVYLGLGVVYRRPCPTCPLDTIPSGLGVALESVSPPGAVPTVLPSTQFASGASPGTSADEVYFTLNGDSRVFRRVLSTGDQSVVHDFGAAGVAREVHVAGGRLTAIVGGRVHVVPDAELGQIQWDSGGFLHVVDLASDADVALTDEPHLFRRPVLAPTGDRVVAEGYPLIITKGFDPVTENAIVDTTIGRSGDLYLFAAP
ncbi:MAG: hypothetical protein ABJC36_00340 [Gemmatimonadales bacterium]